MFEAFFTTHRTVGTGIGLFVAKQFLEGHGGRIEIESRQNGEDDGTTVRVYLPISTTYDPSSEAPRGERATRLGIVGAEPGLGKSYTWVFDPRICMKIGSSRDV